MNWLDPQEVREWRDKLIARHEKCPPICDDRDEQLAEAWSEFGRAVAAELDDYRGVDIPMPTMAERWARHREVARLIRDSENGEQR